MNQKNEDINNRKLRLNMGNNDKRWLMRNTDLRI